MSSGLDKAIKDFIQIIQEAGNKGTSSLDAQAEVLRIDKDGTAWVHLPGGVDETPVKLTINAEVGDKVHVRLSGGRAWITGNQTAPPTDDKTAIVAKSLANLAGNRAKTAQKTADQAQIVADSALKGTKENAAQMAQMVLDFNGNIESLQNQIDGNITTWFYDVDPAMGLPPVTDWDTDEKKDIHLGDIYYNTVKGYAWRFMKSGDTYSWERITDTDVTKALSDAAKAQDTADSKRRVFYNTPTVPYDAGDLWVQGSGGDILRCAQAKTSTGSYDRNDWVLASKYTDDSALNTWIEGDFATTIKELEEGLVDAKIETYYQNTDPSIGWSITQKSEHKGDLWYNSTASVQKYYRWSGTAWQELTATPPQAVFDNIDKKATIYTGTSNPSNPSSGDLWFKGTGEPILTYVNNSWVEYNKYTDDSTAEQAVKDAANAQSTANTANSNAAAAQTAADQALEANLVVTKNLSAESARIDTLEANKANIDLANVNNAWIANGVIKDASIANEKVISVSANKLTAGTIDASKITVTNLNADNITVGTINGARIGDSSIDLGKLSQEVPTKEYLDSVEQKLQEEIDGAIETFTVSEIPTLNNEPAVNWATDDIKSTHVGDLCYVVNNASDNDGFCYRFQYNGTAYSWALIKDNDVTKAIQDIAELGGEVTQFKTDYKSKVSEIDGGIESLKSRTTTIETTYSTKTYADNKASSALTDAKSYADGTLGEAKSYTDMATADMATTGDIPTKVSELANDSNFATTTQVSNAKSEAISTASADATNKANEALASANGYTDTAVSTKVEKSVFNTLKNTVDENSANITSLTETVTTKADNSTVTSLSNTVNEVKQTADANSSSISSLKTTVNNKADGSKVTALETKTSTIEQNLSGVTTRVTSLESENDGLDTRLTSAESKITDSAIVSTVTSSAAYKNALSGKVDTSVYNTKMEQLDNSISLKATATEVYTKNQADAAFDAKGSASTAKSEAIASAKSYTDTATTDMATEEFVTSQGYLTITSDAITSKVSKNEIISAINQTAESVSIDAKRINLNGAVTFSSFDNSLQTIINNKAETSELEGTQAQIDTINKHVAIDGDSVDIISENVVVASYGKSQTLYNDNKQFNITAAGMELKETTGTSIFKVASVAEDTEISEQYTGTSIIIGKDFKTAKVVSNSARPGGLEKGMYANLGTLADIDQPISGTWTNSDGAQTALNWSYEPSTRTFTPGFGAVYTVEGTSFYNNVLEFDGEPLTPFKITSHDSDAITIASGAQSGDSFSISIPGDPVYTPVGIVSFAVNNGSGSGCSYATFSKLTVSPLMVGVLPDLTQIKNKGQVDYRIRAVGGKITKCILTVQVLWQKL